MKRNYIFYICHTIIAVTFGISLASCSSDRISDDCIPGKPNPDENITRLVGVYENNSWTLDEFKTVIADFAIININNVASVNESSITKFIDGVVGFYRLKLNMLFSNKGWHIEQSKFTYRSVTAAGDSATFSGYVIFPCADDNSSHILSGLSLFHDYAKMADYERPTANTNVIWSRALYNEAVVVSDTQGFGETINLLKPFFNGYAKGRQTVDAAMAAIELMASRNISLADNSYTENMGSSLGAPQALGACRYIESDDCPKWCSDRLKDFKTYASSGPLEPKEVFYAYIERNDSLIFPVIPMMMMYTMFASCPELVEGYKIEDFFDSKLSDYRVDMQGVEMALTEAINTGLANSSVIDKCMKRLFDNHLKKALAPGMLDSSGQLDMTNEKTRRLITALEKVSSVGNWSPENEILISHSQLDDVILYDIVMASYRKLQSNAKASSAICQNPVSFTESFGNHNFSTAVAMARMTLMQHPTRHSVIAEALVSDFMNLLLGNSEE